MFAPEIARLAPPPQPQTLTLSPTWGRPSPSLGLTTPTQDAFMAGTNGIGAATADETSIAQPVAVRGRGARLSFLGRRKDSSVEKNGDVQDVNKNVNTVYVTSSNESDRRSKRNDAATPVHSRRRSFFPVRPSHDESRRSSIEWVTDSASIDGKRKSVDVTTRHAQVPLSDASGNGGLAKKGSVRKRLSKLKLGGKKIKSAGEQTIEGVMGSLHEVEE